MSYSTCFVCGEMVSYYEKYCVKCLRKYKLRQGDWRTFKPKTQYGTPERDQEIRTEIIKDSHRSRSRTLRILDKDL